ncbi:MAG: SCP2 sterol-binding domain-containing protein [Acidimicrobiales bacterium]
MATPQVDWPAAQAAVASASGRLATLLRSVQHPEAPALGRWNLTEVAVHLSHTLDATVAMASGAGVGLSDLWDLSTLNQMLVTAEGERDLPALADRIVTTSTRLVALARAAAEDDLRPWLLPAVELPFSTLTCQALSELIVHGHDIAKAEGAPWPIRRADASMVLRGYLFPVLGAAGSALVNKEAAAGVKATYDIHLRGGGRAMFRFDDGLSVTPGPATPPVDCHLSVDPATFLLVAWGRMNQAGGIATGKLFAYGRKPWLGLKLRSLLRNP